MEAREALVAVVELLAQVVPLQAVLVVLAVPEQHLVFQPHQLLEPVAAVVGVTLVPAAVEYVAAAMDNLAYLLVQMVQVVAAVVDQHQHLIVEQQADQE